uniref:p53 DNA-binding domain-containing protein n=1 Tax=Glossina brevipalpis TaxID=37001 RepID=A0A1A9W812_9MUSC
MKPQQGQLCLLLLEQRLKADFNFTNLLQNYFGNSFQQSSVHKINLPPSLEEHDEGNYNCRINVQAKGPQIRAKKSNAVYSENLNKLCIKKNENVYIDVHYTLTIPIQPIRVRTFMVFSKDTNEPILRCQNHICEDSNENTKIRRSMVRREHEDIGILWQRDGGEILAQRVLHVKVCTCPRRDKRIEEMPPKGNRKRTANNGK